LEVAAELKSQVVSAVILSRETSTPPGRAPFMATTASVSLSMEPTGGVERGTGDGDDGVLTA